MIHESLAEGRWGAMSLAEQLGNAGSEYERAVTWKKAGRPDKFALAFARFVELMDLTIADIRWQGPRRRELELAKEQAVAVLTAKQRDVDPGLGDYFLQFAILARADR